MLAHHASVNACQGLDRQRSQGMSRKINMGSLGRDLIIIHASMFLFAGIQAELDPMVSSYLLTKAIS